MDRTADRTLAGYPESGARAAAELRRDPARSDEARRLRPATRGSNALDRLSELAGRLLGTPGTQISLLTDVQLVAAGAGLPAGVVGSEGPLEESLCTVTAAGTGPLVVADARTDDRVRELPPVTSGQVGAYLGTPLTTSGGLPIGALCVFGPDPRAWSESDIATLRQLADSAVTELELSALVQQYENDRLRWGLAIDAAGIGTFDWDLTSGRLSWDDQLITMFGYDTATFEQTIEAFNARLHPDDLERVTEALQQCIATVGEYDAEYRVVRPDGETRWVHARGRALAGATGAAVRVLGAAYDTTGAREGAALVTRVLEAMPAGFYSLDREWRFTHVNAEGERLLASTRDDLLGRVIWEAFPAAVNSVFEDSYRNAVRTGEPVSFDAYYPAPLDGWYELRAWPTPDGLSVYFLEVTERRRMQDRAERSARRLALLAQVSTELAGTLDAPATVGHLPRVVVPALADFCIVTLVDPDGRPRDVASWHTDPASRPVLERYAAVRLDAMPTVSPVARVLVSGESIRERSETVRDMLPSGEAQDLVRLLDPHSAVVLPMRGRGRILGLLTLYFRPGTAVAEEDLATAQDVADRAGLALDNARLYTAQQQLAEGLQRSLLTEPPEPDHAEIAVRYLPAAEAARVGGDWYDAFLQPGGSTMLVIGDVVGHDTEAAAAMGQLRGLLRGIATYSDAGPVEVLRGLDASMSTLRTRTLATAAIARFEQTPDELRRGVTRMRWANAGHLPPLVVNPDGSVAELASWRGDLLLGVDAEANRRESVVTLDRGATVLLYTDGLIERRDADLDAGLVRLRDALIELADLPLQEMLDELLERLVHGRPEDDVALVAVRLHPQDRPRPPEAGPTVVPPGF
ncbi:SpoIIE family protein phosphatase [Blastococcus tunisiensis]|uniref:Serine phosphatase RsbU, regulator of sigma subunit n=1 Tax=Blastococcus tunisiensis TaxID=1798228 RepID=A0A1I2H9V0_9ACTN|nr:SpoIIE family protein phosphatase [Blastococcus sp. DSM 46838]SFF26259.1 Serine phosphatase RsbU, regulator of sigma subunit [Blastococcus sp. DSM 46838]